MAEVIHETTSISLYDVISEHLGEDLHGQDSVTLFSKNNCVKCTAMKNQLKSRKVPYLEVNVSESTVAYEFLVQHKIMQLPAIFVHLSSDDIIISTGEMTAPLEEVLNEVLWRIRSRCQ
ncbi:MAG: hypothetical protein LBI63_03175 [Candidatus Ancillula sp.]|jgi:glutaredoxin|nr:hypothetical protein [Candidatus Ancillula sp.]